MNTSSRLTNYNSYLLRIWNEGSPDETPVWRFSLQDTRTHAKKGFPTLEKLFAALENELADSTPQTMTMDRLEMHSPLL